jgi:protein NrfC
VDPLCVTNCPVGAASVDSANGNVRVIDQTKCIGCQTCLRMCPHPAHRTIWDADINKSSKCDLCADAKYLGDKGGPDGKQACVMSCPMGALAVVTAVPNQTDDSGYVVNLRTD